MRTIITVDGLAGSGKTTLAHMLSQELRFIHLNSGLLYRGVGWLALSAGIQEEQINEQVFTELIKKHQLALVVGKDGKNELLIDGQVQGDHLFEPQVSHYASKCASYEGVRLALLDSQRGAFPGHDMLAEGRDMGTVVFPNAQLKFFITADAKVRATRRMSQLESQRGGLTDEQRKELKDQLEQEITERDKRDIERAISPTVPAKDAIILDNSCKTLTEMVKTMYDAASQRGLVSEAAQ